jgi:hypothetical protein
MPLITSDLTLTGLNVMPDPDREFVLPGGVNPGTVANLRNSWLRAEHRLGRGIGRWSGLVYVGDLKARKRVVYFVPPPWWTVAEAVELVVNDAGVMVEDEPQWGGRGVAEGYRLIVKRMLRLRVDVEGTMDPDAAAVLVEEVMGGKFRKRG